MAYSNGFDTARVLTEMVGRLGWRVPTRNDWNYTIDEVNATSRSGRYFDSFHDLVNALNLVKIQNDYNADNSEFNAVLLNLQKDAIMKCLTGVFNEPEFIQKVRLFDRYGNTETPITNDGKFVGYEIKLAKAFDKAIQINNLELYFDSAVSFNIYLFRPGSHTPDKTKQVITFAGEKTTVALTDWVLRYSESDTWYIGYFQDDLDTAKAIGEDPSFNKTVCFSAKPFYSVATDDQFDRINLAYPDTTYGLNLQVSVFKDFTQHILNQSHLFDEVVGLQVAFMTLEKILFSLRINSTSRILQDGVSAMTVQQLLYGSVPVSDGPPPQKGMDKKIEAELTKVKKAFYPIQKSRTVNFS